jgi:hypothetical protein
MTREQAIRELKIQFIGEYDRQREAKDMAIKALEQEPILDKVRAEMFEEMLSHSGTGEEVIQAYADGLKKGLEIIDKYKAETEET